MSQLSKALKKIATSEAYIALVEAINTADYEAILKSYLRLSEVLGETKRQILKKIQDLPRQNKDEDTQKFQVAFSLRVSTALPQWHWLDSQLKSQKVMEGEVFGFGSKGDPLVRTPGGRVVIIKGSTFKEGERIRYRLVAEGEKLDFGRSFELTPDYFYFLLNHETRTRVRSSLDSIRERLQSYLGSLDRGGLAGLSDLLRELEDVRGLTTKLQSSERERALARILAYRKKLLSEFCLKLSFDIISQREEKEIVESCRGNEQQAALALAAPGLFNQQSHEALKAELFAGEKLKGYSKAVADLESKLDSMNAALELLEFRSGVEGLYNLAREYVAKMDRLFERLHRRAKRISLAIAEDSICSLEDIHSTVREAFSRDELRAEFRRVFRTPGEFYRLRRALAELRARLGNKESLAAEAAIRDYHSRIIAWSL